MTSLQFHDRFKTNTFALLSWCTLKMNFPLAKYRANSPLALSLSFIRISVYFLVVLSFFFAKPLEALTIQSPGGVKVGFGINSSGIPAYCPNANAMSDIEAALIQYPIVVFDDGYSNDLKVIMNILIDKCHEDDVYVHIFQGVNAKEQKQALYNKNGNHHFPQVYMNGKFIGGRNELEQLSVQGLIIPGKNTCQLKCNSNGNLNQ